MLHMDSNRLFIQLTRQNEGKKHYRSQLRKVSSGTCQIQSNESYVKQIHGDKLIDAGKQATNFSVAFRWCPVRIIASPGPSNWGRR